MPFDTDQRIFPYIKNGRFFNFKGEKKFSLFANAFSILSEWWSSERNHKIDLARWYNPAKPKAKALNPLITWVGHSTFLIQLAGINILVDPIFGKLPFFKRILPPGITLKNLPKIDYVLISHNHPDHFDYQTIKYLIKNHKPRFFVPLGDRKWFLKRGCDNAIEFNWWDEQSASTLSISELNSKLEGNNKVSFTFLPSFHWSQRGLFDFNKSLWGSWLINFNGYKIYFAGDTAYAQHFKAISKVLGPIDVALLPIGPCEPQEATRWAHVNAEEAGQAFLDLKARHFIPMHWGTFNFGQDQFEHPLARLRMWWKMQNFTRDCKLYELGAGHSVEFTPELDPNLIISQNIGPRILEFF